MNDAEVRRFLVAAQQNLEAAGILLHSGKYRVGQYLAGFGVECALKAMLLSHVPRSARKHFVEQESRGSKWHAYDTILQAWRQKGGNLPAKWSRDLRRLRSWTNEMRYETARVYREDAVPFYDSARAIIADVEEKLT